MYDKRSRMAGRENVAPCGFFFAVWLQDNRCSAHFCGKLNTKGVVVELIV